MYWVFYAFLTLIKAASIYEEMYAVKHTQLLANHKRGRLLSSLQSATPIQTAFRGLKQDRKLLITSKL